MSAIKCLYGFSKVSKTLHHIDEAINDRSLALVCPSCMKNLTPVNGKIRARHFRHDSSDHDNHCSESALHIRAKTMLSRLEALALPLTCDFELLSINSSILSTKNIHLEHLDAVILSSSLEIRVQNERIVPDCTLIVDFGDRIPRSVCLEVYVTHSIDEEKLQKIRGTDSIFAEIDLSKSSRDIGDEALLNYISDPKSYRIYHEPEPVFSLIKHKYSEWSQFRSEEAEIKYQAFLDEACASCSKEIDPKSKVINVYKSDLSIDQIPMAELNHGTIQTTSIKLNNTSILLTSTIGEYSYNRGGNPYPYPHEILEYQIESKYLSIKYTYEKERISASIAEYDAFIKELVGKQWRDTSSSIISPISNLILKQKSPVLYGDALLGKIITLVDRGLSHGNFLPDSISKSCVKDLSIPNDAELKTLTNRQIHISKNITGKDYELYYENKLKNSNKVFNGGYSSAKLIEQSDLARNLIYAMEPEVIQIYVTDVVMYLEANNVLAKFGTSGLLQAGNTSIKEFFESYFKKHYREIKRICSQPNSISPQDENLISLIMSDLNLIKNSVPIVNLDGYERMLKKVLKSSSDRASNKSVSMDIMEAPF